jgi:hypothetical protein
MVLSILFLNAKNKIWIFPEINIILKNNKNNKNKNNKKFKVHDFKTDLYKKYLIPLCKIEKEKKIEDEKKRH